MYVWHDKTSVARNLNTQHRSGVCNDLVFYYRRTPLIFLWPALGLQILKHIKFSLTFKEQKLLQPCFSGIKDFFGWLMKREKNRKAVSIAGFKKFIKLK